MTGDAKNGFNQTSGAYFGGSARGNGQKDSLDNFGKGKDGNTDVGGTLGNTGRSCSVGGKSALAAAQELAKAKSYKNRPYINNAKMGTTDYKFNYG